MGKWIDRVEEEVSGLQDQLVDINFACTDAPHSMRKRVPGRLQIILRKTNELLSALQILSDFGVRGQKESERSANLATELQSCREEAIRLLNIFREPVFSKETSSSLDVNYVFEYVRSFF